LLKRLSDGVTRSCPNDVRRPTFPIFGLKPSVLSVLLTTHHLRAHAKKCEEKKCTVRKVLLQQPHVFAVGLVWPTPNPTAYEIVDMLSIISQQIRLSNIFNGVPVQVSLFFFFFSTISSSGDLFALRLVFYSSSPTGSRA
jgi:hypothetical protein